MKSKWHALLALFSTAAVVAFVWFDLKKDGQGELSLVHDTVEALQHGQACELCHGQDGQNMQDACLECHPELTEQIKGESGFHFALPAEQLSSCGECHAEHLGNEFQLAAERSFRLAGFSGPDGFAHEHGEFSLLGRHDSLKCAECHPNADAELLHEGEFRYIGLTQTCEDCHDDPHQGKMMRSCESCHGQEHEFKDLTDFQHDEKFPLHDSHAGLVCAKCHEKDGPFSVAANTDPSKQIPWRACQDCHQSPHQKKFLGEDQCSTCHSEKHTSFAGHEVELATESHSRSGFALEKPHAELACAKCHSAADLGPEFSQRFPGRSAEQCVQCHKDPHNGQFEGDTYSEKGCLSCHHPEQFSPHEFDLNKHQQTQFSLTGAHVDADCQLCHKDGEFKGVAKECEACHDDVHRGEFLPFAANADPRQSFGCASCHETSAFSPTSSKFEHDVWTHFPLKGSHAEAACLSCHALSETPDAQGRSFGRVSDLHPGDPQHCEGCHEDVHHGEFDRPGMSTILDGKQGCARCHNHDTFAGKGDHTFAHAEWTSFALLGAHSQAKCTACHGTGESLTPQRRLGSVEDHYSGDPSACASCHLGPHDGLFNRPQVPRKWNGVEGCARCHENLSFRQTRDAFDHSLWTSFELIGAHQTAVCSACHAKLSRTDPVGRNSARAPGENCASCHQDVHVGQFAVRGQTDCESCHAASQSDFKIPDFDHEKQTEFLLDQSHQGLECAACHKEWPLENGGKAVRFRGIGTACEDCHQVVPSTDHGGGR